MIVVNVWWVYLAPKNIPSAVVLTLGNKVVSCIFPQLAVSSDTFAFPEQWQDLNIVGVLTEHSLDDATLSDTRKEK